MIYDGVINKPPLETLMHFNPNHDPQTGQFTNGPGGGSGSISSKKKKNLTDEYPGFKSSDVYSEDYGGNDWIKLDKLINKKSGDWYNSRGVSKGFKDYVKKYERLSKKHENDKDKWSLNSSYRKEREKLQEGLVNTVLDDLGYEHNKKNKEIIRNVLFWD